MGIHQIGFILLQVPQRAVVYSFNVYRLFASVPCQSNGFACWNYALTAFPTRFEPQVINKLIGASPRIRPFSSVNGC
jgi:hypothetical protein